jgi:hypothetical protein
MMFAPIVAISTIGPKSAKIIEKTSKTKNSNKILLKMNLAMPKHLCPNICVLIVS